MIKPKFQFNLVIKGDFSLATDLADWLVLKGIPFREAHHIVGEVVKRLEESGENFLGISLEFLKNVNPVFDESALKCLDIKSSLERKLTAGSPNPAIVKDRIINLRISLKKDN